MPHSTSAARRKATRVATQLLVFQYAMAIATRAMALTTSFTRVMIWFVLSVAQSMMSPANTTVFGSDRGCMCSAFRERSGQETDGGGEAVAESSEVVGVLGTAEGALLGPSAGASSRAETSQRPARACRVRA